MADRENGRIQCFLAQSGEFVKEIKKEEFGGKVFAIAYSPVGGELPGAPHPAPPPNSQAPLGELGRWPSPGPLLVHFWSTSGPVLVQSWSTPGPLPVAEVSAEQTEAD